VLGLVGRAGRADNGEMSQYASPRRLQIYWWALSFQGGVLNAGGILSCGRGVSHVTGFGTSFGTEGAQGHWHAALGLLSVPLYFLTGSIASTFLLEHPKSFTKGRYYGYSIVLGLIAMISLAVSLLGWDGAFGNFNASLVFRQHYILLALLSFACGLQNALFTERAGTLIRSTHMTGPVTDLGIDLGRYLLIFLGRGQRVEHIQMRRETHIIYLRAGAIGLFIVGALLGSMFFLRFEYLGFLVPAFTALVLFVDSFKVQRRLFFD
jgi:uncharacterized membrane protein YoaK (UPF0700 family)